MSIQPVAKKAKKAKPCTGPLEEALLARVQALIDVRAEDPGKREQLHRGVVVETVAGEQHYVRICKQHLRAECQEKGCRILDNDAQSVLQWVDKPGKYRRGGLPPRCYFDKRYYETTMVVVEEDLVRN
jgi:hypothetical protein